MADNSLTSPIITYHYQLFLVYFVYYSVISLVPKSFCGELVVKTRETHSCPGRCMLPRLKLVFTRPHTNLNILLKQINSTSTHVKRYQVMFVFIALFLSHCLPCAWTFSLHRLIGLLACFSLERCGLLVNLVLFPGLFPWPFRDFSLMFLGSFGTLSTALFISPCLFSSRLGSPSSHTIYQSQSGNVRTFCSSCSCLNGPYISVQNGIPWCVCYFMLVRSNAKYETIISNSWNWTQTYLPIRQTAAAVLVLVQA